MTTSQAPVVTVQPYVLLPLAGAMITLAAVPFGHHVWVLLPAAGPMITVEELAQAQEDYKLLSLVGPMTTANMP